MNAVTVNGITREGVSDATVRVLQHVFGGTGPVFGAVAPTVCNATVQYDGTRRYAHFATCPCGWESRGYIREHAAQTMADDHNH